MPKLFYVLNEESNEILISEDWLDYLICIGEVKERTLKELKSLLDQKSWVYEIYTDEQLIIALELKDGKTLLNVVTVYTDGSCNAKTKLGGIGVFMSTVVGGQTYEKRISIGYENTKTGRMELTGIITAMREILPHKRATTKLNIYCDSQYAVNCIAKKWLWRWKLDGALKNRINGDLLVQMIELHDSFPKGHVYVQWVKGHADNVGNIEADKLAGEAYRSGVYLMDKG